MYKKQGYKKECPPQAKCLNCMPAADGKHDECWAIKNPITYKVRGAPARAPPRMRLRAHMHACIHVLSETCFQLILSASLCV